jgi:general secretion pathway protein C
MMTIMPITFSKIQFTHFRAHFLRTGAMYNVVFIFALAYFFLFISSIPTSISPKSLTDVVKVPSALDREKTEENERDFLLIKDWHLFGNAAVEIDEVKMVGNDSKETDLPIKLLGIFLLPDQDNSSYVIIEDDAKEQKKYHLGDELPGGATLLSVAKEHVILLRNQQTESLSMVKERTGLLFITK